MKAILVGLSALSLFAGVAPKIAAQNITITVGPATDDSYWIWNDEYQVWVWNGPEFQGDYQGHPYSYWHGRHEAGGDRNHRPGKGENNNGVRPASNGEVEQPKALQPRTEVERPTAEQPKPEAEKPKEEQPKSQAEKPKEQQPKPQAEKPKGEEKDKIEKPKPEEKKDDSKPKGE